MATPEGYARNPRLVQQFYNDRRRRVTVPDAAEPGTSRCLAELGTGAGDNFLLVTQNIDNLHEQAEQ